EWHGVFSNCADHIRKRMETRRFARRGICSGRLEWKDPGCSLCAAEIIGGVQLKDGRVWPRPEGTAGYSENPHAARPISCAPPLDCSCEDRHKPAAGVQKAPCTRHDR